MLGSRITDLDESAAGPMVASLLQGQPFKLAMGLNGTRQGTTSRGDAALAMPSVPADPMTGQAAEQSGMGLLLQLSLRNYNIHAQDFSTVCLDAFFEHRRSSTGLLFFPRSSIVCKRKLATMQASK